MEIENSKHNSLDRLLFGLGIRYVGRKTAKILARRYKNLYNLFDATEEELINIPDVGDRIASSVYEYFHNLENGHFYLRYFVLDFFFGKGRKRLGQVC